MVLTAPAAKVLKDALATSHKETFERSLGRAVRKHGGTYQDYVELVSQVREIARKRGLSPRDAAKFLADQP